MMEMITQRTRLRRFNHKDARLLSLLESDPEVVRHTRIRTPLTLEQTKARLAAHLEKGHPKEPLGVWGAEFRGSGEFIGWFMLLPKSSVCVELGYMIVRDLWGRGLTTEICKILIESAFQSGNVSKIEAITDRNNLSSVSILGKLGFKMIDQNQQGSSVDFVLQKPQES